MARRPTTAIRQAPARSRAARGAGIVLPRPTFEIELTERARGCGVIAGIDEAGRGPWAGPVVAAAVVLDEAAIPDGLDDSKKLTAAARETAFAAIIETAEVGIGVADVARIDRDNILQATLWAMRQAVRKLPRKPGLALIDGNRLPARLGCEARAIVEGDAKCLSIAAASIVAKVTRDRMMAELALRFPGYGFEQHKGYGVPEHQLAIARLGVTPHHRRSFRPIRIVLGLDVEAASGVGPLAAADTTLVGSEQDDVAGKTVTA